MPYITIESGALSDEQKENLIKRLTEVSSEIMNVPQESLLPLKNYQIKILVLVENNRQSKVRVYGKHK